MALMRFNLDLAIPEAAYKSIPEAKKLAFRTLIRELKALAIKINQGQPNEEMTMTAGWHRCLHDEGKSCEPEQEI